MVKFLIIRFSSIGDILLTTPVLRCLKNQVEEAEIHYVTKQKYAGVLHGNPYITRIHLLNKNTGALINELKKENFDYIIDLHNNIRTFRIITALRRMYYTVNKLNIRKWILVNFKLNYLPEKHIVDRYMETLRLFSVKNDRKGLDYFMPESKHIDLENITGKPFQKLVSIVVGGGHYTKQIPSDKIIDLIEKLEYDIVLLGGEEDILKASGIMQKTNKTNVFNLTGRLGIGESALIISKSDVVVTPDTGMMHIASAFKKNIISMWGNTIPEFGMYPYFPGPYSRIFEIKGLSCRPCSKIGFAKCPKKHFRCMADQDMKEIINSINNIVLNQKSNF